MGLLWFIIKQVHWELINETWGIAYGMVSHLKLATIKDNYTNERMDDSTQGVTWWLEMVKIARKDFEVLSKGEGQATAWRPKNLARVKKEVLVFSWGTNQAMMAMLMWRIKSLLEWLIEVTWYIWGYSNLMNEIKSRAQDGYAQVKKIKVDMLAPSLDEVWNTRLRLKENNSKGLNLIYIWIWVNRNAVLLRGMHHVDR